MQRLIENIEDFRALVQWESETMTEGGEVSEVCVKGVDFSGTEFCGTNFRDVQFLGCIFQPTIWRNVDMNDVRYTDCTIKLNQFDECTLTDVVIRGIGVQDNWVLRDTHLSGCIFEAGRLNGSSFINGSIKNCHMEGASFLNTEWNGVEVEGTDMTGSDWSAATMVDCQYTDCSFRDARWIPERVNGCGFVNSNFRGATVAPVQLWKSNMLVIQFDSRSYRFVAVEGSDDDVRIFCGCRDWSGAEAIEHWGSPHYDDTMRGMFYVQSVMMARAMLCGVNQSPY